MNQKDWYKTQKGYKGCEIDLDYMLTCTACGIRDVVIHICTEQTRNEHINLCDACYKQHLGYVPLTNKKILKFFTYEKNHRTNRGKRRVKRNKE